MRALVWFGLDGAASLYSHDDDGAGLVLACGPERAAPAPRPRPRSREPVAASAVGNAQENHQPWAVCHPRAAPGPCAVGNAQEAAVGPAQEATITATQERN